MDTLDFPASLSKAQYVVPGNKFPQDIFFHRTSWIHLFHHLAGKLGFQEEGESVDEDNAVEDVEHRLEEGGDAAEHLQVCLRFVILCKCTVC